MNSQLNKQRLFEHFFAIPEEDIKSSLASREGLTNCASAFEQSISDHAQDSAQQKAFHMHVLLLVARTLEELDCVPLHRFVFMAGFAADAISADVVDLAMDKGRLKELRTILDSIKTREDRSDELGWLNGNGPADYEAASDQFSELIIKIKQLMMVEVFRRYGLSSILKLYEMDPLRYYRLCLIGQKECLPKSVELTAGSQPTSPKNLMLIDQGLRICHLATEKQPKAEPDDLAIFLGLSLLPQQTFGKAGSECPHPAPIIT
ncbi:MAG TPA: hypothetical protein VMZ27_04125 [Candidatus Saccharimonadales bacterium]|nr:hypothetical protein [Candidatus Saccharimonadales bacterium]